VMVESEAKEIYENVMLGVIVFGHEHMQAAIQAIKELVAEAGKPAWEWDSEPAQDELVNKIKSLAQSDLQAAYKIHQKQARTHALQDVREKVFAGLNAEATEENPVDENAVKEILHDLEADIVRSQILNGEPRIDGRDTRTVRPIGIELGFLPRAHGSALFTRGETQALVVTRLATRRDEQILDSVMAESRDGFMMHCNLPTLSSGAVDRR